MKKILLILIMLFSASVLYAQTNTSQRLKVTEEDGSPSTYPRTMKFTNGSVTDNGDGSVSVSSGGGTPGGSDTQIQYNDGGSFAGDSGLTWLSTSNSLAVDTNTFYVDGSGNFVGIHDSTPTVELEIADTTNTQVIMRETDGDNLFKMGTGDFTEWWAIRTSSSDAGSLIFREDGTTQRFRLLNGGGFELGSSLSESGGTAYYKGVEIGTGGSGTPGGSDTNIQYNDGGVFAGEDRLKWLSASDSLQVDLTTFNVDGDLNYVGIGTATPYYRLMVKGTNEILGMRNSSETIGVVGAMKSDVVAFYGWDGTDFNDLEFRVADLTGSGVYLDSATTNVGIGTTSPTSKLDINGDLTVQTDLTVTRTLYIDVGSDGSYENLNSYVDGLSNYWDIDGSGVSTQAGLSNLTVEGNLVVLGTSDLSALLGTNLQLDGYVNAGTDLTANNDLWVEQDIRSTTGNVSISGNVMGTKYIGLGFNANLSQDGNFIVNEALPFNYKVEQISLAGDYDLAGSLTLTMYVDGSEHTTSAVDQPFLHGTDLSGAIVTLTTPKKVLAGSILQFAVEAYTNAKNLSDSGTIWLKGTKS